MNARAQSAVDSRDPEVMFETVVAASAAAAAGAPHAAPGAECTPDAGAELISRVGHMTRALHEALRALGYDKALESAASEIPDARDRLNYVSTLTEQAAQRALNATEAAKPIQAQLAADAGALALRWDSLMAMQPGADEFKALAVRTREFLGEVPERARATNAQLTEVMLAQDFQDLTGQVIKKIMAVVQQLETQLLNLLLENVALDRRHAAGERLNGPVVNGNGRADVVTSQAQVDDLLESLGF